MKANNKYTSYLYSSVLIHQGTPLLQRLSRINLTHISKKKYKWIFIVTVIISVDNDQN